MVESTHGILAKAEAAERTLLTLGYTYNGGRYWKPPLGKKPEFVSEAETEKPARYYLFAFKSPTGTGNLLVHGGEGDGFPSNKALRKYAADSASCKEHEITITGWSEFKSKADYEDFISTQGEDK